MGSDTGIEGGSSRSSFKSPRINIYTHDSHRWSFQAIIVKKIFPVIIYKMCITCGNLCITKIIRYADTSQYFCIVQNISFKKISARILW